MENPVTLPDSTICAGVDLGGTKIAIILGTSTGQIRCEAKIDTLPLLGPKDAISRIAQTLEEIERRTRTRAVCIGMGVPGLADAEAGVIRFLPNLPTDWHGFPAADFIREMTGRPAFLLNDARLAALGEYSFGKRAEIRDLLVVTVGTGIGGGLILDGHLRLGRYAAAGEIGHHTIIPDGPLCTCGNRGCLETLVNGRVLAAEGTELAKNGMAPKLAALVSGDLSAITPREMAIAAREGDECVALAIERAAQFLGIGIANAVSITAVDHVVITGGLGALGDLLLEPIRKAVRERVRMFPSDCVVIERSSIGDRAGALGALALAFQKRSNSRNMKGDFCA